MSTNQLVPIPVGTLNFAAGAGFAIDFARALSQLGGRLLHARKITFVARATPTLSSGTATPEQLQKAIKSITIKDGVRKLFEGSLASMRLIEALENGRLPAPEPDAAATTEQVNFQRTFDLALPQMEDPNDFLTPLAVFKGGSIAGTFGALTDVNANVTALTMVVDVYVWCTVLDDLLLPPMLERIEIAVISGQRLSQEALYMFLALCKTNAFGAFSAGDIGNIQIFNEAFSTEKIDVRALQAAYYTDMDTGSFSQVQGEPRAATDDNAKQANGTALSAPTANMQPVIWTPKGGRMSKTVHSARPDLVLNWDGTNTTSYGLISRLIPRTEDFFGKYMGVIASAMPFDPKGWPFKERTLSRRAYKGPRKEYVGLKFKAPKNT